MYIDVSDQIVTALKQDYQMKQTGDYLYGVCPDCSQKTLWAGVKNPWLIQCNRHNGCQFTATAKELFPFIYEDLCKKYPPTTENPNQTADVYMSMMRGFNAEKLNGCYEQGKYWHPQGNKGTATVRFYLNPEKTIMWERLIDDVTITDDKGIKETRNKNFKGSFKGLWWQPPKLVIKPNDEIYLVEGIFDAIALNLNGYKAVSMMSSVSLPADTIKQHTGKGITWILGLDNDEAGLKFAHKHAKTLRDMGEKVTAAFSSDDTEKLDWNDLHKAHKLSKTDMALYRHYGDVELADDKNDKAYLLFKHSNKTRFVFDFKKTTYSCKVDMKKLAEEDRAVVGSDEALEKSKRGAFASSVTITVIATFTTDYLYFQQPEAGDDGQYFLRLKFANGSPDVKQAFNYGAFSSAAEFKRAALRNPAAQFTGSTKDIDLLYAKWNEKPVKQVRSIDYVGYDKSIDAYVYNDFAVEKGKVIKLNKEDYFQLNKIGVKSVFDGEQTLSTQKPVDFIDDALIAFGVKSVIALAWQLGSLFAEQIRADICNFPFIEIVGDKGSGKSQMVDLMCKLVGKNNDGFNPNSSSSTPKGIARKLASVSNLPIFFNETDNENEEVRSHTKRFAWDEIKPYYEGGSIRMAAVRTNDNTFKEMKFKAALAITQNIPVTASPAIMSRIVHLYFGSSHHSFAGKQAADRLKAIPISDLSGFLLHALQNEKAIMVTLKKQLKEHSDTLRATGKTPTQRIIDNHALVMALIDCLSIVLPVRAETIAQAQDMAYQMAVARETVLRKDHPIVEQFWYLYDYLGEVSLNHSGNEKEIAVNLEHFRSQCVKANLETIDSKELRYHLQSSSKPKFLKANHSMYSHLGDKNTLRCWVFEK